MPAEEAAISSGWSTAGVARLLVMAAVLAAPIPSHAIDLELFDRRITGSFDTTLTAGVLVRVAERDEDLIAIANGGKAFSSNVDDGDLNYDFGDPASSPLRVNHELELHWRNYGAFGRALYFYDPVINSTATDRTPLGDLAKDRLGLRFRLLDAYATGDFKLAGRPLTVRFGNQVISWGESTFIPGINVINPIDLTQLRSPGAELRNALLPVPAVDVSVGLFERLSVEAFYQLLWEKSELEPLGTYFSTSDIASDGAQFATLTFGALPDYPIPPRGTSPPVGVLLPRAEDREARDSGQGGVALRYFEPRLWGTEFGLYYIHYHSRFPLISARTGTRAGFEAGDFARSSFYFREFPDDIDLFAGSFSTELATTGVAVQGELSYKYQQPLQIDDVELLFAGFTALPGFGRLLERNQVGVFGFRDYVQGFRRKDVLQPQVTLTKLFGPRFGADQLLLLAEIGATLVMGMESKSHLRYEGPGTFTGGDPFFTRLGIQPATQRDGFANARSWGYRLVARPTFNRAIGAVNLEPTIVFQHDVDGTTPLPIANFVDGRKAVTLAVRGIYLEKITGEIGYTNFFGGGNFNLLNDRDYVAVAFSYSF
jgi:hypothetical protein